MKTTNKFKTRIFPKNENIFCIEVVSVNYFANINTIIEIDRKTNDVVADFVCNPFVDARTFINELSREIKIKINSDSINRFGMI